MKKLSIGLSKAQINNPNEATSESLSSTIYGRYTENLPENYLKSRVVYTLRVSENQSPTTVENGTSSDDLLEIYRNNSLLGKQK